MTDGLVHERVEFVCGLIRGQYGGRRRGRGGQQGEKRGETEEERSTTKFRLCGEEHGRTLALWRSKTGHSDGLVTVVDAMEEVEDGVFASREESDGLHDGWSK